MRCVDKLATACFAVVIASCTVPAYLLAKLSVSFPSTSPLREKDFRSSATLVATTLGFRLALRLCCWIRVSVHGLGEFRKELRSGNRPFVYVSNHVSFMDAVLVTSLLPINRVARLRGFVANRIMRMRILGVLAAAMGHCPVPFKDPGPDGEMDVDKERMSEMQLKMERHILAGGDALWFPEGTRNALDVHKLGLFRAGGFSIVAEHDVEIWCISHVGNTVTWPRTAAVGGRPARIGVKISRLCSSSQAFLAEQDMATAPTRDRAVVLANAAQKRVQADITSLVEAGFSGIASPGPRCCRRRAKQVRPVQV